MEAWNFTFNILCHLLLGLHLQIKPKVILDSKLPINSLFFYHTSNDIQNQDDFLHHCLVQIFDYFHNFLFSSQFTNLHNSLILIILILHHKAMNFLFHHHMLIKLLIFKVSKLVLVHLSIQMRFVISIKVDYLWGPKIDYKAWHF